MRMRLIHRRLRDKLTSRQQAALRIFCVALLVAVAGVGVVAAGWLRTGGTIAVSGIVVGSCCMMFFFFETLRRMMRG